MAEKPPGQEGATPSKPTFQCPHCPQTFESSGELGRHLWTPESEGGHKERMIELQKAGRAKKAEGETKRAAEEAKKKEAPPTPPALYKGEPDATGILREILESHPDIGEAVKNEILSWAGLRGQLDPQTVAYLLSQMRGVSSQTASIVAQKYSLALQKSQLEGRPGQVPLLPQLQLQQPPFQVPIQGYPAGQYPFQFPQVQTPSYLGVRGVQPTPQYAAQPQPQVPPQVSPPYQPYQPRPEKTYKLVVDGQEIETDEKGFMAWKRYLDEQKKPSEKPPAALSKAEIEDIMSKTKADLAGAFSETLRQDRAEREKSSLALSVRESTETTRELMKKIEKGELIKIPPPSVPPAPPLTEEKVADIVGRVISGDREKREKEDLVSVLRGGQEQQRRLLERIERGELFSRGPQALAPITKEDIAKAIEASSKATREDILKFIEAKSKEEAAEKRHSELLSAIRSGMSAREVSGYREDSYRLLGQGLTAAAGAIERKEPVKIILEGVPQVISSIYPAPPGPKEIMPGAEGAEMARAVSKLEPRWVSEH